MARLMKANDLTKKEADQLDELIMETRQTLAVLDEGLDFYPRHMLARKFLSIAMEMATATGQLGIQEAT